MSSLERPHNHTTFMSRPTLAVTMSPSSSSAVTAHTRRSPQLMSLVLASLFVLSLVLIASAPLCAAQSFPSTVLPNDVAVVGSLPANATAYFSFAASAVSYQQTTLISVAASTGSPSLYVSLSNPNPSASSFDYAASWQTGGVVSITATQPPYTAYVAVVSSPYSPCNFTVLATAYDTAAKQTTPVLLSTAQPVASVIAAGEYRYFTYPIAVGASLTTIALTETYGQSVLLINSPNATALPTVASSQYASSSAAFPLVALQQPAAGMWTIGVWSNASSAFTIIAADNTSTQAVELGVTYPGYAPRSAYFYYSINIDASVLAGGYLDIELYSIDGDADMYCSSSTARPSTFAYRWQSSSSTPEDRIILTAVQLANSSTLYCGVTGFIASNYLFSASAGATGVLTAGETLTASSAGVGVAYYSLTFPAAAPTYVTLSVVSEVGSTALYIQGAGAAPTATQYVAYSPAATTQALQLYSDSLCGFNNTYPIPGSSPPLCQMQVLLTTPAMTVYRIVATVGREVVTLVPGEPVEVVASSSQPALLSVSAPDALSNMTLYCTITNGVSGLAMMLTKLTRFDQASPVWYAQQLPGSDTLVFQLDYTDPLLPGGASSSFAGEYIATLTTASDVPVSFSAVYTVTNGSVYSDSIVQLLDGVPQQSVLSQGAYDFYYFTPPAAGWPYAVTISVAWQSGYGILRAASSLTPRPFPLPADSALSNAAQITVGPGTYRTCNPTTTSCIYSVSVQSARGLQEPAQYAITVTTGLFVQELIAYQQSPTSGSALLPGNSDYWQTTLGISGTALNPNLLYALSVTSGSLTAYLSNTTSAPNTSTAQMAWTNLTSAAVLTVPVQQQEVTITCYLTVACTLADGSPCAYTIQMQKYDERVNQINFIEQRFYGNPVTVLVPPAALAWVGYNLQGQFQSRTAGYIVVQASAVVGTAMLYASCINYAQNGPFSVALPDETSSTWQSAPGLAVIELYNFNTSAANCSTLVVGVRASGGQAVQAAVSASSADQVQNIGSTSFIGYLAPQYPVAYYRYTAYSADSYDMLSFAITPGPSTSSCDISQLQLAVSDTNASPDSSRPSTYNFSRSAVPLANGYIDLSVVISNYTRPAGSLHTGYFWAAVQGAVSASCQYRLTTSQSSTTLSTSTGLQTISFAGSKRYMIFPDVPFNASVSFGMQLWGERGLTLMYVAINTTPTVNEPSSYLFSNVYNTTLAPSSSPYAAQPIYIPASLCSAPNAVGTPCDIVILVITDPTYGQPPFTMRTSTSADATWLLPNQAVTPPNPAALTTQYQFSLPASPTLVTLTVATTCPSSPLFVYCSYQVTAPDLYFNDWMRQVPGLSVASSQPFSFAWANATASNASPQLTNANTQLEAAATTCYCSVVKTNSSTSYSISLSTTPIGPSAPARAQSSSSSSSSGSPALSLSSVSSLSSSSSASSLLSSSSAGSLSPAPHTGLSGGALAAAVVVPVVVVLLLLLGLLLWRARARGSAGLCCCGNALDKHSPRSHGTVQQRQEVTSEQQEVSMTELGHGGSGADGGKLIRGQWRSD